MGVVHNSIYYIYMELARTDLVRVEGVPYKKMEDEGVLIPVVKSGCTFFRPAHYDDEIVIETSIEYIRNASLKFDYHIRRDGGVDLAKGFTVHATVDADFEVAPFPDKWRPIFTKYLAS